jgi:hypothetical protein
VADAGPDVTVCPGQSTTLTASGGTTYQWSNGATTASTVVSPSATTTYVVTVTQPGCGTDTDDVTVVVEPFSPAIELSAAGICPGGSVTLSVNVPATSYLWSTGATTPTIDVSSPGVYSVTVGTAAGCTGTAQVTVQPLPEPSVSVSVGNSQVCEGDCATVQLTFVGTPPFNYTWQYQQGGNPVGGSQSGSSGGNTTSFLACPPGGPGDVQVVICSLTDANCPN